MDDQVATAHHESGHACVALLLGVDVDFVSLDLAVCRIDDAEAEFCDRDLDTICRHVCMKFAGPLAELAFNENVSRSR